MRPIVYALIAIVLWGTLAAVVGDALAGVGPFRLLFWSFAFAAPTLVAAEVAQGRRVVDVLRPTTALVALGLWGILGYHAFFYVALQRAPIVEANLLNYLWPLFMVLLAPVLARERLTPTAVVGALTGFAGAVLIVTQGKAIVPARAHLVGYACAFVAALAWSSFSVLLKRMGAQAEGRMPLFMVASLIGAAALALTEEGGLAPPPPRALLACAFLGVFPLGLAFVAWGKAMATGSAAKIGALSYLDPLLSTLLLALVLRAPITQATALGMVLIVVGAASPAVLPLFARR